MTTQPMWAVPATALAAVLVVNAPAMLAGDDGARVRRITKAALQCTPDVLMDQTAGPDGHQQGLQSGCPAFQINYSPTFNCNNCNNPWGEEERPQATQYKGVATPAVAEASAQNPPSPMAWAAALLLMAVIIGGTAATNHPRIRRWLRND